MSRNFLRACSLTLSGSSSITIKGGGPTDLRITFAIEADSVQSPNPASFRIYNAAPDTVARLKAKEFSYLSFSAGYEGNMGVVCTGDVKQSVSGHETTVDSFVAIYCAGSDRAHNQARVSQTLAAGWRPQDKLQAALQAMQPFGVTMGLSNVDLSTPVFPRGIPLVGMARDLIREVAFSKNALWSIHLGEKLHIVDGTKPVPGNPQPLNSATGMVGWPQQTENGIVVRSLINSRLQPNSLVRIAQKDIIEAEQANNPLLTDADAQKNFNLANTGLIAADGIYRILYMRRVGDTRGLEWYDESTCLAAVGANPNQGELDAGYSLGGGEIVQSAGAGNTGFEPAPGFNG